MSNIQTDPAIHSVIQTYVQGYLQAQEQDVSRSFHAKTVLYSTDQGKLEPTPMEDWLSNLRSRRQKGDVRTAELQVHHIDQTDDAAVAKITLTFAERVFTDYLSFLLIDGQWKIIGKIYTIRARHN